ncbi:MAG: tRNA uridine-5-carboxymethylaminomethyl(34) synthesis GTPase MnmE [Acidobacteria bacterium]|nr:tRNA uridine-5-carboxymethylaminomethyl(34) synthesis GTPase MnmE [Acidobacteriota bacterium]
MLEDTIVAVSTPFGFSGLGIVRLSGDRALPIALNIFLPKSGISVEPHHPALGYVYSAESGEKLDEAFLTYFPKPRSYTREDIVEISCHGSPVVLEETVRLCIAEGARHADPGEFTLRAVINGRMDIIQAEAVHDLITATSLDQARISFNQMQGRLSRQIENFRTRLIHLLSRIEASLEFPDDDLEISVDTIMRTLDDTLESINHLIGTSELGQSLSEGTTLVIAGTPNVGKSTLFNSLLERDRAIVTPQPGTTRDYITEKVFIDGALFSIIDTAGMTDSSHPVEKEGIKKSIRLAEEADGVLLLIDLSRAETADDLALMKKYGQEKTLLVLNKNDLPFRADIIRISEYFSTDQIVQISALEKRNIEILKKKMRAYFTVPIKKEQEVVLHLRQKLLLQCIRDHLKKAKEMVLAGYSEELYIEEIRLGLPALGQLTGNIQAEDVFRDIFARFCVGK